MQFGWDKKKNGSLTFAESYWVTAGQSNQPCPYMGKTYQYNNFIPEPPILHRHTLTFEIFKFIILIMLARMEKGSLHDFII